MTREGFLRRWIDRGFAVVVLIVLTSLLALNMPPFDPGTLSGVLLLARPSYPVDVCGLREDLSFVSSLTPCPAAITSRDADALPTCALPCPADVATHPRTLSRVWTGTKGAGARVGTGGTDCHTQPEARSAPLSRRRRVLCVNETALPLPPPPGEDGECVVGESGC